MLRFWLLIATASAFGAVPTLVQTVSCSNSGVKNGGSGTGSGYDGAPPWDYYCSLAEPSQSGNLIIVGVLIDDTGADNTITVSDDKSNTYNIAVSQSDDSNTMSEYIFYAMNVTAGTTRVDVHLPSGGSRGYFAVHLSEFYNVAAAGAYDAGNCHTLSSSSTSITSGSVTPAASGDLFYQDLWGHDTITTLNNLQTSITASSQSNLNALLLLADLNDGSAAEYGIYNSTSAINPTMAIGTADVAASCSAFFKATTAGTAPTQPFRIVHLLHQQQQQNQTSPMPVQFPSTGNEIIISANGVDQVTGVSSTPSNTWSNTGTGVNFENNTSMIWYACGATTATTLSASISLARTDPGGSTYLVYDMVGAPSSNCFDNDSGGLTGDETSDVSSLTMCASCLTPTTSSGIVLANFGQYNCTVTSLTAPSGGRLDSATFTGNGLDGPQAVDQNNGWLHFYTSSATSVSVIWGETCPSETAESYWVGRVAHFNGPVASTISPPVITSVTVR